MAVMEMWDPETSTIVPVPHWYFITYSECPMCGRTTTYRERRYEPHPERWEDRHAFEVDTGCASDDAALQ